MSTGSQPAPWRVERTAPVRADAEGLFVPSEDIPRASIGDRVVVEGREGGERRTGTIVELTEHEGQSYWRLALER